jgi:hypothetical protein
LAESLSLSELILWLPSLFSLTTFLRLEGSAFLHGAVLVTSGCEKDKIREQEEAVGVL